MTTHTGTTYVTLKRTVSVRVNGIESHCEVSITVSGVSLYFQGGSYALPNMDIGELEQVVELAKQMRQELSRLNIVLDNQK